MWQYKAMCHYSFTIQIRTNQLIDKEREARTMQQATNARDLSNCGREVLYSECTIFHERDFNRTPTACLSPGFQLRILVHKTRFGQFAEMQELLDSIALLQQLDFIRGLPSPSLTVSLKPCLCEFTHSTAFWHNVALRSPD